MLLAGAVLVIQVHCCLGSLIWDAAPATETMLQAMVHQFILLPQAKIQQDSAIRRKQNKAEL
jgi:hypothetical protein